MAEAPGGSGGCASSRARKTYGTPRCAIGEKVADLCAVATDCGSGSLACFMQQAAGIT